MSMRMHAHFKGYKPRHAAQEALVQGEVKAAAAATRYARLNLDTFRISEVHCSGGGVCSMTADSLMKCPSHYCVVSG
jgi:hypothetical protein